MDKKTQKKATPKASKPSEPSTSAPRNKGGRKPKLTLDQRTRDLLRGLGRIQCTDKEAAAALGVALDTMKAFFKREPAARDDFDDGKQEGFVSLRRSQFRLAEKNAAMGIWLGKQYLGQRDRLEHTGEGGGPISVNVQFI